VRGREEVFRTHLLLRLVLGQSANKDPHVMTIVRAVISVVRGSPVYSPADM